MRKTSKNKGKNSTTINFKLHTYESPVHTYQLHGNVHKLIALRLPATLKIPIGVSTEYDYPVLSLSLDCSAALTTVRYNKRY
jgi:hypothetical protein